MPNDLHQHLSSNVIFPFNYILCFDFVVNAVLLFPTTFVSPAVCFFLSFLAEGAECRSATRAAARGAHSLRQTVAALRGRQAQPPEPEDRVRGAGGERRRAGDSGQCRGFPGPRPTGAPQ